MRRPVEVYGKLASLGFSLRQHCQFLMLALFPKILLDGFNKNKGDCHQYRIIRFLKMSILKDTFVGSVDLMSQIDVTVIL